MAEYTLPFSRCGQYSANVHQGVVGGIPFYADGVTNNSAAFASALAACTNDHAVVFPAGGGGVVLGGDGTGTGSFAARVWVV